MSTARVLDRRPKSSLFGCSTIQPLLAVTEIFHGAVVKEEGQPPRTQTPPPPPSDPPPLLRSNASLVLFELEMVHFFKTSAESVLAPVALQ